MTKTAFFLLHFPTKASMIIFLKTDMSMNIEGIAVLSAGGEMTALVELSMELVKNCFISYNLLFPERQMNLFVEKNRSIVNSVKDCFISYNLISQRRSMNLLDEIVHDCGKD